MSETRQQNIAPYGHLEAHGHGIIDTQTTFPGVRGKLKKAIQIDANTILPSGTLVIIQPLNRDKPDETPRFKLTPYRPNKATQRNDQPESKRDIITDPSHEVTLAEPDKYLSFNNEHYRRYEDVLFPTPDSPSLAEINQARIPNCFLLAAIQTIINHPNGKAFIRGMMHQNSDGTTTVRLYDPDTLKPEYIRVENSVIVDSFGELNLHNGLWIHILEKAYAARGKKKVRDQDMVDASVSSVYSEGGHTIVALKSLTGLETAYHAVALSLNPLDISTFMNKSQYEFVNLLLNDERINPEIIINYLKVNLSGEHLSAIYDYLGASIGDNDSEAAALEKYVELIKCYRTNKEAFNNAVKNQSTKSIKKSHPIAANILAEIFTKSAPFSGYYSQHQLDIYQQVNNALKDGKLVTASTNYTLDDKPIGIIGNHAYTVLGSFEKTHQVKDSNGNVKTITSRFLRLRNPWGDMDGLLDTARDTLTGSIGRDYEQNQENLDIRVTGRNEATFIVELSDFCKYYNNYNITAAANETFARDTKKEECIAGVTEFVQEFSIDFSSSIADILAANAKFQQQLKNLIQLELLELKKIDAGSLQAINKIFDRRHEERIEKSAIQGLLSPDMHPNISGTEDDALDHVYYLLKLNWLLAQPDPDKVLETDLVQKIQEHAAQPELWEQLSQLNVVTNIVTNMRAKNTPEYIENMLQLSEKLLSGISEFALLTQLDAIAEPQRINAVTEMLIANFMKLEELYHQTLSIDTLARNVKNASLYEQQLHTIAETLDRFDKFIKSILEAQPLFTELWAMREDIRLQAADMEKKHDISPEEHKEIQTAITHIFSGEMRPIGNKLLASTSEQKQALGAKLVKADSIATKIKKALSGIRSFFSRIASHLSTFFHTKNSYEIPALDKPKLANPNPEESGLRPKSR